MTGACQGRRCTIRRAGENQTSSSASGDSNSIALAELPVQARLIADTVVRSKEIEEPDGKYRAAPQRSQDCALGEKKKGGV